MQTIHIKTLEKYHPGYQDRTLIWCKAYFKMLNADPEFEMLCEIDKWRFIALVMLELQTQNPVPWDEKYLKRKGFNFKKRPMSLTIRMLQSFVEVRNGGVTENPENVTQIKKRVEEKREDNICVIFNHWNSFKKPDKKWKTHTKITPDIERAIANARKDWSAEDVCAAITNFAKVVQGRDYTWTYAKWGLFEFLNRRDKDDRTMYRWWRFQPSRFVEADWLTDDARRKRIETGKEKAERESPIKVVTAEEKQQIAKRKPLPFLDVKMKTAEKPMSDAEFQNKQAAQLEALKSDKKVGS